MTEPKKMSLREIDAEIAMRIMGWTHVAVVDDPEWNAVPSYAGVSPDMAWQINDPRYAHEKMVNGVPMLTLENVPNYSLHIDFAWQVAEKLQIMVWPRMSSPGWCAAKWSETNLNREGIGYLMFRESTVAKAATAPLAITLASLAAVGVHVEVQSDE